MDSAGLAFVAGAAFSAFAAGTGAVAGAGAAGVHKLAGHVNGAVTHANGAATTRTPHARVVAPLARDSSKFTGEHLRQQAPLWEPKNVADTHMTRFRLAVNAKHGLRLDTYEQLREWSIDNIADFWALVWDYTRVIHAATYTRVLDETVPMPSIPEWFTGARLNLAENMLWAPAESEAIVATGEGGGVRRVTYGELRSQVAVCATALRKLGVQRGDRVVGYIANCVEAVVAFLATASLGAIWSSTSPDFGTLGVLERFTQIKPKVIFSVNAVHYNGKVHDHMGKLLEVVQGLTALEHIVVVSFVPHAPCDLSKLPGSSATWDDFMTTGLDSNGAAPALHFEQVPFSHPAYILFSSGTTGVPKCLVHSVGGPLIQHKKEHMIHGNLGPGDVVFQYTTTGWMMWNWLLGALTVGATVVLFDGSPFKPDALRLWQLVDELKVTAFGTSAKYLATLLEMGVRPRETCHLRSLHSIYSTGSPLSPECFDFVYRDVKRDVLLGSVTGGTDIVSLFAGANRNLPVYRGEIQCRNLGMSVEAWTLKGEAVEGVEGDLVCTKPFPCMPVFFWNDADRTKYTKAYFAQFPGVWYHGDFLDINPHTGGIVMLGRSDGTLNPGGVRIGTAEIYNLLETYTEIQDTLVVGQKQGADERVILFVKMTAGRTFNDALVERIKKHIRAELSPRHVPTLVLPIAEIPYTINGKKVEVAVKKIISGETVVPSGALANPAALDAFYDIPALAS